MNIWMLFLALGALAGIPAWFTSTSPLRAKVWLITGAVCLAIAASTWYLALLGATHSENYGRMLFVFFGMPFLFASGSIFAASTIRSAVNKSWGQMGMAALALCSSVAIFISAR